MRNYLDRASPLALFSVLFLLAPVRVVAQTQTGEITGVVTDAQGALMPGVTVTAQSEALIVPQVTVTSENGRYTFINLQPGLYTVIFEMPGFGTVTRDGVRAEVARTTTINQVLNVGSVTETITVTAESPAVDVKSNAKSTNFDAALLENIPQAREIWSTVEQVPGATMSKFNVGGAESAQQSSMMIHGSAVGQQEYAIDGLKLNWPGGNGGATAFYFDLDSYAEINIMTNGAPAEVGTGGVYMNMVTKSGGNNFSGGSSIYWSDGSFQSDNVSGELEDQGVTSGNPLNFLYDINVHAGGAIKRDKIWWFSSYRRYDIDRQILGVFREDGSPAVDVNHQTNLIGKVTAQVNDANKIMVNGNFNYQNRFFRRAGANFVEEVASRRQIEPAYIIQGQWTSVASENLFLDFRYGYLDLKFPLDYQDSVSDTDLPLLDIITSRLSVAALERFENIATRHQFDASATYFKDGWGGSHQFKTGFQFGRSQNSWERSANGNVVRRLANGVPFEVQTYNYPLTSENITHAISAYVQDTWVANQRLTVNYGGRFESFRGFAPAQGQPGNQFFPAREFEKIDDIPSWNNFAGRLGVTFDVTGDGRTAVKGYLGRFLLQEGTRLVETLNPNARSGDFRSWNDANGNLLPELEELGPPTRPYGGVFTRIDPDLERPYSDEFNLGVEREISPGISVGVTYYKRNNNRLISGLNVAVPPSAYDPVEVDTPFGPTTAFNQDPDTLGDSDRLITNIDALEHRYNGVEFTFTKRMSDNWQLVGGYTVGAVKGVFDRGFGDDFNNPNLNINREDARIDKDSTHVAKIVGTYVFPGEWTVSTNLKYFTGQPVLEELVLLNLNQGTQRIAARPRGETRLDNVTLWDFRVSKVFRIADTRLQAIFDVFNLLNQSSATQINTTVGPSFGQISEILSPRVLRLGLQFQW